MLRHVKRVHCCVTFAILVACAVSTGTTQAQRLLRWKLQPGETMQVQLSQDMNTETSIGSTPLKSSVHMLMMMNWQILEVNSEGTAEIAQSIERIRMNVQSPGAAPLTYDSAATEEPTGLAQAVASGIRPFLGVKFIQSMTSRGEIISVRLSDEAAAALDEAPSGNQIKQMFSSEGLKSLVSQAAAVLPEGPVSQGDQWHGNSAVQSPWGN